MVIFFAFNVGESTIHCLLSKAPCDGVGSRDGNNQRERNTVATRVASHGESPILVANVPFLRGVERNSSFDAEIPLALVNVRPSTLVGRYSSDRAFRLAVAQQATSEGDRADRRPDCKLILYQMARR